MNHRIGMLFFVVFKDFEKIKPSRLIMQEDILIKITNREGVTHQVQAPTDMNLSIMELIRSYELAPAGTVGHCGGRAMCTSCQCQILNDVPLNNMGEREQMLLLETKALRPNIRLGCQIPITENLEGLELELLAVN
ncbi:Putidaredoxin [compost metagenome]